jgi:hypothetical protein
VEAVDALHDGRIGLAQDRVVHVDPAKHEDAVLDLDLATRVRGELPAARLDLARLQRAPEGAGQSARGGRDEVVEGRRVGRERVFGDAVVLRDLVVYTERHGSVATREPSLAHRPAAPDDPHLGGVDDISHDPIPLSSGPADPTHGQLRRPGSRSPILARSASRELMSMEERGGSMPPDAGCNA